MTDYVIKRIVEDNPLLDGAEAITVSVTRGDRTKRHYYIFNMIGEEIDSRSYIPVPMDIVTRTNGNGKYNHYIIVAVLNDGYVVFDMNKNHEMKSFGLRIPLFGLKYEEAEEIVKFKEPKDFADEMEEALAEANVETDENNEPLPF